MTIDARDKVSFDGQSANGVASGAASRVEPGAVGAGANINIKTGSLFVTGGAQLNSSTEGRGDAGNVIINASNTVLFDGVGSNGSSSQAVSRTGPRAQGNGGNINITDNPQAVIDKAVAVCEAIKAGNLNEYSQKATDSLAKDDVYHQKMAYIDAKIIRSSPKTSTSSVSAPTLQSIPSLVKKSQKTSLR